MKHLLKQELTAQQTLEIRKACYKSHGSYMCVAAICEFKIIKEAALHRNQQHSLQHPPLESMTQYLIDSNLSTTTDFDFISKKSQWNLVAREARQYLFEAFGQMPTQVEPKSLQLTESSAQLSHRGGSKEGRDVEH